jgi:hypothetical protein
MISKILAAITIATLFIGCNSSKGPFVVGFDGPPEQYLLAYRAAWEWNAICNKDLIHIHNGIQDGDDTIVKGITGYVPCDFVAGNALGCCSKEGEGYLIDYMSDNFHGEDGVMEVIAHEFGHMLGSGHTSDGLMQSVYDPHNIVNGNIKIGAITADECDRAFAVVSTRE